MLASLKTYVLASIVTALTFSEAVSAYDIEALKQECAELGFKKNTPDNGNCALKLLKRAKAEESNQAAFEAQQAQVRAQQAQQQYQAEQYRQQQAQQMELQQRAIAAQEELARAQKSQANWNAISNSLQMLNGTGAYYKPPAYVPPAPTINNPINCFTNGNYTTCQ